MKKMIIGVVCVLLVGGLVAFFVVNNSSKQNTGNEASKTSESTSENLKTDGYQIIVSKEEITLEKGKKDSFEVTFTNSDLISIREYINCKDQGKIVNVSYTDIKDGKLTIEVEALKEGTTEIEISDYEYPEIKEIVKVNVSKTNTTKSKITREMAYEGVNNYCHKNYDWSAAEDNSSIMYVEMGDETESEYKVIFRNYTGALVYFYVNKSSGTTRITEFVPTLNIESEAGNINLYDYINKNN